MVKTTDGAEVEVELDNSFIVQFARRHNLGIDAIMELREMLENAMADGYETARSR